MKLHFIYKLLVNGVMEAYLRRRYHITTKKYQLPDGPNLIISNHVTNLDFIIIETVTKGKPIHTVLADNIVKKKLIRKIFVSTCDPIIHVKGANAMMTSKEMFRRLQNDQNVLIFPEGNTSFDGTSAKTDHTLGMIARLSGANLVMMRIKGGYFTKPRWRDGVRRGEVSVDCEIIKNDKLLQMSQDEMADAINRAIYTDAYSEKRVAFKGKNPCKGLERAIYQCPECAKVGTLKTDASSIHCTCGFHMKMDEFGYLRGDDGTRHTITEYVRAQYAYAKDHLSELNYEDEVELFSVVDLQRESVGKHRITASATQITCENMQTKEKVVLDATEIRNATIYQAHTLNVFTADSAYELIGDFSFNALKYRDLFEILRDKGK